LKEKYEVPLSGILLLLFANLSFAFTTGLSVSKSKDILSVVYSFLSEPGIHSLIILLSVPVILSPFIKYRIEVERRVEFIVSALLIIPVVVIYSVNQTSTLFYPFIDLFGVYFIILSVLILYKVKRITDLLSVYFLGVFILIISGLSTTTFYFETFIFIHFLFFIFYFRNLMRYYYNPVSPKFGRRGWLFIVILLVPGWLFFTGFNSFIYWLEPAFNFLIVPTVSGLNYGGISDETSLNVTGSTKLSTEVVMRIYSDYEVSRVRSKIYTEYLNGKWKTYPKKERLSYYTGSDRASFFSGQEDGEGNLFFAPFGPKISPETQVTECRIMVKPGINTVFFTMPSTFLLKAGFSEINTDQYGIFYPAEILQGMEYSLAGIRNSERVLCPEEDDMTSCLILPAISPEISALAAELTGKEKDDYAKCLTVERFFHENFSYTLGFKPESGGDPVEEFLLKRSPAHCEYFATAMVFLLRSAGIPSRYATGFLVHEYNRFTGYYVVRERDAHAWVEAFVPGRGWVTFDPTPPGGEFEELLGPSNPGFTVLLVDFIMFRLEKIKDLFIKGDYLAIAGLIWKEISQAFIWFVKNPLLMGILLILVLAVIFRKKIYFTITGKKKKEKEEEIKSPEIKKLHSILKYFDKVLKKKGFERKENLTLYEYGRYLREEELEPKQFELCSDFIDRYCKLRYATSEILEGDLLDLEKKLREFEKLK